ncbi:TPA: glycosyltransferase family 4 protein, partial [Proteus mirabilis]|nr:glycosyltransferase family 4 protein [Proteus mirabilis]
QQISLYRKNKEIIQIPPGVDLKRFNFANKLEKAFFRKKYNLPEDKIIILCLGRFVKVKNFEVMIHTMCLLNNNYHLLLVGDGTYLNRYLEKINSLNIKDKVTILEPTLTPEEFYKASDIFCLPSTYEPFGQVLLEATACHLPIIALNSDNFQTASKEIYQGYDDLITFVDKNLPESFRRSILKISTNYYNSSQAHSFLDKHSWDQLLLKIIRDNDK